MLEKNIWASVLEAIADGDSAPQEIAKIALSTREILK